MAKPDHKNQDIADNPVSSELDEPEHREGEPEDADQVNEEEDHEDNEDEEEESEEQSESDEKSVHHLIEDMPIRSRFLTKVGFLFTLYFFFLFGATMFVIYAVNYSRHFHRRFYFDYAIWIILILIVSIKVFFGFAGGKFKWAIGFAFIVDILLSMAFVIGLYFWVDSNLANRFTNNAPKVFIYVANFLTSAIVFTCSTYLQTPRNTFAFGMCIFFLTVTNGVVIFLFFEFWQTHVTITLPQYAGMFTIISIINMYISLNAYLVVRFQTKVYYDNDSLQCFYRFWVDWFSYFWIDGFRSSNALRKLIRERRRKNKLENEKRLKQQRASKAKIRKEMARASKGGPDQPLGRQSKTRGPVIVG
jgi:hypothetical protein